MKRLLNLSFIINRQWKFWQKKIYFGYKSSSPFKLHNQIYMGTFQSIGVFYAILAVISLYFFTTLPRASSTLNLNPPKTFSFLSHLPTGFINLFIELSPIVLFSCFYLIRFRLARIVATFSFIFLFAYKCSFNHNYHNELILIYTALVFCLIPTWGNRKFNDTRSQKHYHILLYSFGLFVFLFPYTLSGLWKLGHGMIWQLFFDDISFWNINSMSYVVSSYIITSGKPGLLSGFIIENPIIGYFLLLGGIFWELIVILPLFRPMHWRLTSVLLILFHLLSVYILNIQFNWQMAAAVLFIYYTPLYQPPEDKKQLLITLPLIGPGLNYCWKILK